MKRRTFLAAVPITGLTSVAGCLTDSETADNPDPTSSSTQGSTMTQADTGTNGNIGIKIDNQTAETVDVNVQVTENDDVIDKLDVSIGGESIESVDTAISSVGTYDLEVTTARRSKTFTHAVEQRAIENELQIIVTINSKIMRSYIQE
ncbi:hypothetical protein PNP85_00060 [Halobacterium salinarum]|uniref:Uncharacterized protein n=2 Tax=Halobacterium salinarum TaxID=2242 RepID=A0A841HDP5_HALSI|nr:MULTISPECIES: hypothetical protein [Halobacterium]MBB6090876.1 hypothetical protein [Halobacterium salinarum]MDL0137908.1 hypothetical protein [Halobacterium salinarum]QRY21517.1 hypothetical protein JT689_00910 [Halobacterium sp. GSL-19]UEB93157.1 hypothetical protein LJ422_11535 [Halobacterium salinarum NRC-34001]